MIRRPPRSTLFPYTTLSVVAVSLDRKSTPLNSSHTIISYAVFCLKKNHRRRDCAPGVSQRRAPLRAPPGARAGGGEAEGGSPRGGRVADARPRMYAIFFFLTRGGPPTLPPFPPPPSPV